MLRRRRPSPLLSLPIGVFLACSAEPTSKRSLAQGEHWASPAAALSVPVFLAAPAAQPPPSGGSGAIADARSGSQGEAAALAERDGPLPDVDAAPDSFSGSPTSELSAPLLIAVQREVQVYAAPSFASRRLGYLRAGARVPRRGSPGALPRAAKAATRGAPNPDGGTGENCPGGFVRIAPDGYVCVGAAARLEDNDVSELLRVRPDRLAPLPYLYAKARLPTPPYYTKLPNELEQRLVEPDLSVGRRAGARAFHDYVSTPIPASLADGRQAPTPYGRAHDPAKIDAGRALPDSSFALLALYERGPRRFGLTSDLLLVPLDRLEPVKPSEFHGIALSEGQLSVAFVMQRSASLYAGSPQSGLRPARRLGYREAIPLSGRQARAGTLAYLQTTDGDWIRDEHLIRAEPVEQWPGWAKGKRTWIHVSIGKQTLVAYEGSRPVYATLVSTGADRLGEPETTRSTVRGQFVVHTKHVSVRMSSDEVGDEYDLRDVPYVQYFREGYALHAAYWHDGFGTPRSHGCVNLSPRDARWLFHWTEPSVPQLWHGAYSLLDGTLIYITA